MNSIMLSEEDASKLFKYAERGIRDVNSIDGETRRYELKWLNRLIREGIGGIEMFFLGKE